MHKQQPALFQLKSVRHFAVLLYPLYKGRSCETPCSEHLYRAFLSETFPEIRSGRGTEQETECVFCLLLTSAYPASQPCVGLAHQLLGWHNRHPHRW